MEPAIVTLRAGDLRLDLVPELGGTVLAFTRGGTDIFRPALPGALQSRASRGLAAYPLVPYSNRIDKGRFHWRGTDYAIPATFGGNAIHGVGWTSAWNFRRESAGVATLFLDHASDEFWPFPFHAAMTYELAPTGLAVAMRVENRHADAAPVGIGLHPFFPRDADTALAFAARGVWLNKPDMIPDRRVAVPRDWDHAGARVIGGTALDNCFAGWHGPARMTFPRRGHAVTVTADPLFAFLIVYVPLQFDFFAVEPVSNMNDAINHMDSVPDHGLRVLTARESLEGRMHFAVQTIAP